MTSRSRTVDPEVVCRCCGYHYRRSLMIATDRGYHCVDRVKCNGNIARQGWYRRGAA